MSRLAKVLEEFETEQRKLIEATVKKPKDVADAQK